MKLGTRLSRDEAMTLAIEQAKLGAPFVSPNPQVGCVILNSRHELINFGHHQKYGEAHAEINALSSLAPDQLNGAHVFVTLEPCAHQGKTGSCAKKLAEFPLSQVTYGLQDPFPLVAGQGAEILRAAGIKTRNYSDVSDVPDADPVIIRKLRNVCEIFLKNVCEQKIFIGVKLAQSMDGKMFLTNGQSKWITSEASRKHAHYLRAVYDVIAVGSQTVLIDNPSLDVRDQDFQKTNTVLIVDPSARTWGKKLRLLESHPRTHVLWAVSAQQNREHLSLLNDPQVIAVDEISSQQSGTSANHRTGPLNLWELQERLWQRGLKSLLVEGGAHTISGFLQAGVVDRLHLFQAPKILGGSAPGWASTLVVSNVHDAQKLDVDEAYALGPDFYLSGRFK